MKIYDYNGKKNICGKKIRDVRKKAGLSQTELAIKLQLAGVTIERDSISRIESGTRFVSDYEVKIICEIFDIDADWLLS